MRVTLFHTSFSPQQRKKGEEKKRGGGGYFSLSFIIIFGHMAQTQTPID